MKKKRNLIGVCLVAVLMLALTVIGYAAGDGACIRRAEQMG